MTAFNVESWIWYGFATSMVLLRLLSRYLHFNSITRLQVEDWFMVFITCLYTILIVSLNICAKTNSNLIDPHDIPYLTPQDVADRVFGSKMILVVEQCMCAVQWGTKACLLMLYWRLTENLTQSRLVKGAVIYVAVTYIVMEVLYFGVWCRPFHDYWQTPTDNVQCTTALHHLIVNLVFNLTADLLIMSIPLPLLMRSHIQLKRKILLILPFSLGFFSIVCAILSKNLSFTQPFSGEWVYWYAREASTVMIVSNMPYTWGLVRKVFHAHSFFGSDHSDNTGHNTLSPTRTRDTGMEMVGGETQVIRGVPMPVSRISDQSGKRTRQLFRSRLWHRNPGTGIRSLASSAESQNDPVPTEPGMRGQWPTLEADQKNIRNGFDPTSSSSSAASVGLTSHGYIPRDRGQSDDHAIDRLYRLNDDDLLWDIEKEIKRSDTRVPS